MESEISLAVLTLVNVYVADGASVDVSRAFFKQIGQIFTWRTPLDYKIIIPHLPVKTFLCSLPNYS